MASRPVTRQQQSNFHSVEHATSRCEQTRVVYSQRGFFRLMRDDDCHIDKTVLVILLCKQLFVGKILRSVPLSFLIHFFVAEKLLFLHLEIFLSNLRCF